MATQHVIGSSNPANHLSSTGSHSSSSSNIVGVHYKVGKKIGEGSFGVIFEGSCRADGNECVALTAGTNLLNSQTVAIKFVRVSERMHEQHVLMRRNHANRTRRSCEMNIEATRSSVDAVSDTHTTRGGPR